MEERERVAATVCVSVCLMYGHVCTRAHIHALITSARDKHTHIHTHSHSIRTHESPRESSSICRTSMRVNEKGRGHKRRMAEDGRKTRGWTVSREVTRECRAVERVCGLCASCE